MNLVLLYSVLGVHTECLGPVDAFTRGPDRRLLAKKAQDKHKERVLERLTSMYGKTVVPRSVLLELLPHYPGDSLDLSDQGLVELALSQDAKIWWASTMRMLRHVNHKPLAEQEDSVAEALNLVNEPLPVGYFCPRCSNMVLGDPKKIETCPKCKAVMCPTCKCLCRK